VRVPLSNAAAVDPEEALVASLSSCHMLFFLSFAASAGFVIDRYEDEAVGELGKNAAGKVAMLTVRLRPKIAWNGAAPSAEQLDQLHHRAHDACYIANSVTSAIVVEPR
jgi:organic hydroperoxide reductase OsmC/OhrA